MKGLIEYRLKEYVRKLADARPTPGGGSASALVLCLGLGLYTKCLNFSKKNLKEDSYSRERQKIIELLNYGLELIEKDKLAYDLVAQALRLRGETEEQKEKRKEAIQSSLKQAVVIPFEILRMVREAFLWCKEFRPYCNKNILSDLYTGTFFLRASFSGGLEFINDNLRLVKDKDFISDFRQKVKRLVDEIEEIEKELKER